MAESYIPLHFLLVAFFFTGLGIVMLALLCNRERRGGQRVVLVGRRLRQV